MKRLLFIVLFVILMSEIQAQVADLGVSLRPVKFSHQSLSPSFSGSFITSDFSIGISAPLLTIANDYSLGIYGNVALGVPFASSSSNFRIELDQTFLLAAPFYLTLGYGPGTKKGNSRGIGVKAGVGYQLTGALMPNYVDGYYAYLHPQMMAELTFKVKKVAWLSHFKLRYEKQLAQWYDSGYYDLGLTPEGIWFNQQSVSLTCVFSKNKRTRVFDLGN